MLIFNAGGLQIRPNCDQSDQSDDFLKKMHDLTSK